MSPPEDSCFGRRRRASPKRQLRLLLTIHVLLCCALVRSYSISVGSWRANIVSMNAFRIPVSLPLQSVTSNSLSAGSWNSFPSTHLAACRLQCPPWETIAVAGLVQPQVLFSGCFPAKTLFPNLFRRKPKCALSGYLSLHCFLPLCSSPEARLSGRQRFRREVFREPLLTHRAPWLVAPRSASLTRKPGRSSLRPRPVLARSTPVV